MDDAPSTMTALVDVTFVLLHRNMQQGSIGIGWIDWSSESVMSQDQITRSSPCSIITTTLDILMKKLVPFGNEARIKMIM